MTGLLLRHIRNLALKIFIENDHREQRNDKLTWSWRESSCLTLTSQWHRLRLCIRCLLVSLNKDCKHDAAGQEVLCHNPEGRWRWLVSLVYECKRKQRIKLTVSVCSIRLPALFFLLWNQITAAPLLGETISKSWDGGVIEEVKGESKLILSDKQASFICLLI